MSTSTLIHSDEEEPIIDRGHGIAALGPSDTSDSGSDVAGALNQVEHVARDADGSTIGALGGDPLNSDSDAEGTGERASAGNDGPIRDGGDIATDRIVGGESLGIDGNSEVVDGEETEPNASDDV